MSAISYSRSVQVTIDGTPLANVLGVSVRHGYDLRVAEARVELSAFPDALAPWSWVEIALGGEHAPEGRFAGYFIEDDDSLWPKSVSLICRGSLIKPRLTTNQQQDGTSLANQTDQQQVTAVLGACGLSSLSIAGTGRILGAQVAKSFVWPEGQTGLAYIEALDSVCLGYRTFDHPDGTVRRQLVSPTPGPSAVYSYTEGVDIFSSTLSRTIIDARNLVHVTGANLGNGQPPVEAIRLQANTYLGDLTMTEERSSSMVERAQETSPGPGLSCGAVAEWILADLNRRLLKMDLTTYRDELVTPGMTIQVSTPSRLGQDRLWWVQSVAVSVDAQGFSQTLTCVTGDASTAPVLAPPIVDFTLDVEEEIALDTSGNEAVLTVARCRDSSEIQTGTLASRTWTVSGGGVPSTGTDAEFLTGFFNIPVGAASVTLTITDSNGLTRSRTRAVAPAAQLPKQRVLTLAEKTDLCLFNGNAWVTQATGTGADVLACGNAPLWGAGDRVYRSLDLLATPAPYSVPSSGNTVMTLSATEGFIDISGDRLASSTVVAGLADGSIAVSRDGAQTWTVRSGPQSGSLIAAFASPYDAHHVQVVASDGAWETYDDGLHWGLVFAPNAGETVRDMSYSAHTFGTAGVGSSHIFALSGGRLLVRVEDGLVFSLPTMSPAITEITALATGIAIDRLYAVDQLGRCYRTDPVPSTTLVATGAVVPAAGLQPHGLVTDGEYEGLIYLALGSAGLYKSIDGLNGAFYRLRVPGVGGCSAGAMMRAVGFGELKSPALPGGTVAPPPVVGGGGTGGDYTGLKALSLWTGSGNASPPGGWQAPGFDDSGWAQAYHVNTPVALSGWSSTVPLSPTEQAIFRSHFTIPLITVTTVTLKFRADDQILGIWLNGTWVAAQPPQIGTSNGDHDWIVSAPGSVVTPGATNTVAVQAANSGGTTAGWWLGVSYA